MTIESKMDPKTYKVPPVFQSCDFADTIMPDGVMLTTRDEPIVLNNGNVIFPIEWDDGRKKAFRAAHSL
jgi:hypothetical protein